MPTGIITRKGTRQPRGLGRRNRSEPVDLAFIERESPLRPVHWRWDLAQRLATAKIQTPCDDQQIQAATAYLVQIDRSLDGDADIGTCQAIDGAVHLYQGDPAYKAAVEANILARRTNTEVAISLGIESDSVHWFEALFCNVRDRLHATDWIVAEAIGNFRTPTAVLKRFAYFAGPIILDAVLPYLVGIGQRAIDPDCDASIRNAVNIELLPDNVMTHRLLQRLMVELKDYERNKHQPKPPGLGEMISEALAGSIQGVFQDRKGANLQRVAHGGISDGLGSPTREESVLPKRPGRATYPEDLLWPGSGGPDGVRPGGKEEGRASRPVGTPARRAS